MYNVASSRSSQRRPNRYTSYSTGCRRQRRKSCSLSSRMTNSSRCMPRQSSICPRKRTPRQIRRAEYSSKRKPSPVGSECLSAIGATAPTLVSETKPYPRRNACLPELPPRRKVRRLHRPSMPVLVHTHLRPIDATYALAAAPSRILVLYPAPERGELLAS